MTSPPIKTDASLFSEGTVFIQEGVMLPDAMRIDTASYSRGWQVVTNDQRTFDASIAAAGWNFFFTVGKLEGIAFGRLNSLNLSRAMRRILRQVKERNFNAVQITGIKIFKALGLIRYVRISAHARHLQKSSQLDTDQQRKIAQEQSAWAVG
ncbi:MAG TPA: hypothetical protein VKW78_07980 [Terriglobales bacterium]|nr:hypothetical protein [Terriglobales bacterium]